MTYLFFTINRHILYTVSFSALFVTPSELGAKLAVLVVSLASTKLAAKLVAKLGVSWLPIVGGFVSGGINFWLIDGLLDSAYKYYTHDFIILNNPEVIDLA